MNVSWRIVAWALLLAGSYALPVSAQSITPRGYSVDASQTLVLAGSRELGMGGAYAALADDVSGAPLNPAAYSSRAAYQRDWFEWSIAFGILFPGAFRNDDFFNNGLPRGTGLEIESSVFFDFGFGLVFGDGGGGVLVRRQTYTVPQGPDAPNVTVQLDTAHVGGGYSFFDGALNFGAGVRVASLTLTIPGDDDPLALAGAGVELGATLRPHRARWRVAGTLRSPVYGQPSDPERTGFVAGFAVPARVELPWEGRVGAAYQFGPRILNRRFDPPKEVEDVIEARLRANPPDGVSDEDALDDAIDDAVDEAEDAIDAARFEAYEALPRRYLLVSADLAITGAVDNAIGVDAFLDRQARPRGVDPTVAFHLGVEGEPWRNRLKLRAGFYTEPPRNQRADLRMHSTGGFDLRLFRWALFEHDPWDFRLTFTYDVAPQYLDLGLGVGFWH